MIKLKTKNKALAVRLLSDTTTNTKVFINPEYSAEHLKTLFGISKDIEIRGDTKFEIQCAPDAPTALNALPPKTRSV